MNHDPRVLCRLIDKSTAQVLLAFFFARAYNGMQIEELRQWTGKSDPTLYSVLATLEGPPFGLLTHQKLAHGRKLWIPTGAMLPLMREMQLGAGPTEIDGAFVSRETQESKFLTPGALNPATTTTSSLILKTPTISSSSRDQESKILTPGSSSLKEEDPEPEPFYLTNGVTLAANLAACKANHIGQPMAGRLSRMEHVTPELIRDHVRSLNPGETIGLAIRRIESDEMPRSWLDQIQEIPLRDERPNDDDWTIEDIDGSDEYK